MLLMLEMIGRCHAIRRTGSSALNLAYMAAGRFDLTGRYSTNIWDIAAGVLLLREAGGLVTSPSGGDFSLEKAHFLAAANRKARCTPEIALKRLAVPAATPCLGKLEVRNSSLLPYSDLRSRPDKMGGLAEVYRQGRPETYFVQLGAGFHGGVWLPADVLLFRGSPAGRQHIRCRLPAAGRRPPPANHSGACRGIPPAVYYLPDKQGNLQPVLDFKYQDFVELYKLKNQLERREATAAVQPSADDGQGNGRRRICRVERPIPGIRPQRRLGPGPLRLDQGLLRGPMQYKGAASSSCITRVRARVMSGGCAANPTRSMTSRLTLLVPWPGGR